VAKSQATVVWDRKNWVHVTPNRCGAESRPWCFEDASDGGCSDLVTETGGFAGMRR
jgi:hypothetical protein